MEVAVSKPNLTGKLKTAFRNGLQEQDIKESYELYASVRATLDLNPVKRLSSTLAVPTKDTANAKLAKSAKARQAAVGGRAIAQGDSSGIETCPWRTAACTSACLGEEGNYIYPHNQRVKIARARFEYEYPHHAWSLYAHEIEKDQRYADKRGLDMYWRPDIISDSQPWAVLPELFTSFPRVTFYGYTKNWAGMWRIPLRGWVLQNYKIAFSASEMDQDLKHLVQQTGVNVAAVFDVESPDQLPESYLGLPVVDAISDDTWMLQHSGVIGGLKPIGHAMKADTTGFVRRDFTPVTITTKEVA